MVFVTLHYCWWDLTSLLHAWDEATVQTVDGSAPEKEKEMCSISRKCHDHCFLDVNGVVLLDYLEKAKHNGEYYAAMLDQLKGTIKGKFLYLVKKKSFSMRTMHTSSIVVAKFY